VPLPDEQVEAYWLAMRILNRMILEAIAKEMENEECRLMNIPADIIPTQSGIVRGSG